MKKRLLSMILALSMVLTILPFNAITALADEGNLTCSFDEETKTLTIDCNGDMPEYGSAASRPWYTVRDKIEKVVFNEGITSISKSAFYNCSSLKEISLPTSLKKIGDEAFYKTGLTSLEIKEGTTELGSGAFRDCQSLTEVKLPKSLNKMSQYNSPFFGCTNLETVIFANPGTMTILDTGFYGCAKLKYVTLPDSLQQIRSKTFYGCSSLEEITLPEKVTSIGESAFENCSKLKEITIPQYGAYYLDIDNNAFKGCTELEKIYYKGTLQNLRTFNSSYKYIKGLTGLETGETAFTYEGQDSIPVLYTCTVTLNPGSGTLADNTIKVYHTEKILNTKANELTALPEPTAPSGYEFTGWYTSNIEAEQNADTKIDTEKAKTTIVDKDMTLYAGYVVERKTINLPNDVTATVDGADVTIENNQIKAAPNSTVVLTVSDSAYDSKSNYTWGGIDGTPSGDNNRTFTFMVGNDDVTITLTSALRKRTFEVPDGVTVKAGDTELIPVDGKVEVELTKQITLTVKDPKYGDTYKWTVDNVDKTTDATDGGKTLTLTVTDALNKIKLVATKYTYTVGDFDVRKPDDCTYDGQTHPATVAPKADHGIAEGDYTVEYKKDGAADSTTDAPKDAGTYEIIIKKGTEEISAGSFTISPKAPGKDDFTVTLPDGVKEDAEASQKQAEAEVKSGSLLKESGVTIDYSYRKVNADGSKTKVDAPTDAGEYEYVAIITSTNPNVAEGEVSWPFAIGKKTEQPKPDPKPEEKPDRKMKITGGIVEINGKKAEPDEDGNITVKEGDEITITFDKTTLSDAQVFDQWTIKPDSVLNEVDPKSEKISFRMPAETVTVEAMTRDASIQDDGPDLIETAALIGVAGAGAAVLGYQGYMLGTEFALRCMLPAWAVIPQTRAELAVLLWQNADQPESAESTLYTDIGADDTTTQTAAHWAVESGLMALPDAENASDHFDPAAPVTRLEVIRTWNKAQEMKG